MAEWYNTVAEFSSRKYIKNLFSSLDLFQFYEGYFHYKYRLCIIVNIEIEGAETMVYKGNNKTRVCL
ncbi:hypothetical protein MtrunA17_Chr3g0082961 [Medicago truncatula]|uniref:Uncharacterized protein n=1 Tax=Medicago truncatula TaxID=3880 RepID=A0A396IJ75_MEDTR|nr:hypothetical protein MtrunA17_Chr3g0082961 [Medicago truncatula]